MPLIELRSWIHASEANTVAVTTRHTQNAGMMRRIRALAYCTTVFARRMELVTRKPLSAKKNTTAEVPMVTPVSSNSGSRPNPPSS